MTYAYIIDKIQYYIHQQTDKQDLYAISLHYNFVKSLNIRNAWNIFLVFYNIIHDLAVKIRRIHHYL